jgi:hypothetical protein
MRIREATFDDWEKVGAVGRQVFEARSDDDVEAGRTTAEAAFRRPWNEHPHRARFAGVPIGWLLEDESGTCVGTFSNHWGAYSFRGKFLRAGIASAWAVLPAHRHSALMLLQAYFKQPNVDLWIDSSASAAASRLMEAFRAKRMPTPELDICTFWVLRHEHFIRAVALKKNLRLPRALFHAAMPFNPVMKFARRMLGGRRSDAHVEEMAGFDDRFDVFWETLKSTYPQRLLAYRDAASLTWHFGRRLEAGTVRIVALCHDGLIRGYAVLLLENNTELSLSRARLVDLQILDPGLRGLMALVTACWEIAEREGAALVEVFGLSAEKRKALANLLPLKRQLPSWPYLYKAQSDKLAGELADPHVWDPTDYDGDSSL